MGEKIRLKVHDGHNICHFNSAKFFGSKAEEIGKKKVGILFF